MDSSFPNSPFQDNNYAYPYPHLLHAQFTNHPASPSILERTEEGDSWIREERANHEMDGKASKIRSKGNARENEQRSAKTTGKEAKREFLRQKRDSVREWLKQQESVPGPSFEETLHYSSPQDCADTSQVERSQLKISDERREKMERFEKEIERQRDQHKKITFVQPLTPKHHGRFSDPIEIDSSVLDIRNEAGSDANVTSPTPLHPEASKQDIFNALVGVMKRVEDLESQLDYAASNVHKGTGSIPQPSVDDAINNNCQSIRKSQERSSLLDEYYSGIPENVYDEDGERMIQQEAENGREAETESDPSLPVEPAESRGDEKATKQVRNQETQWDLKEEMPTLSDLNLKIQNRKSLAEEMKSADHARLRMSTQNGGQTEEEDEGMVVLVEGDGDGDDIEIVHVDSGSEGAFEVVELDEEEKGSTHDDHGSVLSSVYSVI